MLFFFVILIIFLGNGNQYIRQKDLFSLRFLFGEMQIYSPMIFYLYFLKYSIILLIDLLKNYRVKSSHLTEVRGHHFFTLKDVEMPN